MSGYSQEIKFHQASDVARAILGGQLQGVKGRAHHSRGTMVVKLAMTPTGENDDYVVMRRELLQTLLAEARRESAVECCGFLAGREGVISAVLPARNALHS